MNVQDFTIWRGNSYRVIGWNFSFQLSGSEIRLKIVWSGGAMTWSTADPDKPLEVAIESVEGEDVEVVWFKPTVLDSRTIGVRATYELERIIGDEQRTYVTGRVIVSGGGNND